jgi:hypothetical protein
MDCYFSRALTSVIYIPLRHSVGLGSISRHQRCTTLPIVADPALRSYPHRTLPVVQHRVLLRMWTTKGLMKMRRDEAHVNVNLPSSD